MTIKLKQIELIVERYFAMKINVKSRSRYLVDARKMYFSLARVFTGKSLAVIGNSLNRDHATALHNIRSCDDLRKTDKEFDEKYIALYNIVSRLKPDVKKNKTYEIPRVIHPGYFRYADKKSIRKIFNKRGQATKQRYELY